MYRAPPRPGRRYVPAILPTCASPEHGARGPLREYIFGALRGLLARLDAQKRQRCFRLLLQRGRARPDPEQHGDQHLAIDLALLDTHRKSREGRKRGEPPTTNQRAQLHAQRA